MKFKDFLKWLFPKGFWISYHSKPAFKPEYQERTDAMDDIVKAKEKERTT